MHINNNSNLNKDYNINLNSAFQTINQNKNNDFNINYNSSSSIN